MTTRTAPAAALPFELGEPRSFRGLTLIALFPTEPPELEYIGLDEAVARGLTISEVCAEGIVELLAVSNPLNANVLLYEGEELVGAKQNRILEQTIPCPRRLHTEDPRQVRRARALVASI
jgi:hypothetical protein